jgi:hypothetical protein
MPQIKKNKTYFKNPNIVEHKIAGLTCTFQYNVAKNYPNTSAAMSKLAETENKDDEARKKGDDNYCLSIDKLMDAFDSFIREYSNGKKTAGYDNIYDMSIPCDLTIRLLWFLRHTWTHAGGTVDKKCKEDYEKVMISSNGIKPIIDLPKTIDIGMSFILQFEDYQIIKKCIFEYIKPKVAQKEFEILSNRSCMTDPKMKRMVIFLPIGKITVLFDYIKAYDHGCRLIGKTVNPPPGTVYSGGQIVFPDEAKIPAILISRQIFDAITRDPSLLDDASL